MKIPMSITIFLLLMLSVSAYTQESTDDTCSSIVTEALEVTEQSCNDLDRNQACYGNNRVDVTFWEEQEEVVFSAPSDRIGLLELQSIATSPLNIDPEAWGVAVLNLQTNLPGGLPGQAVTFMLMGDITVENDVSQQEVVETMEPIPATVNSNANIRSQPSTNANIVTTVASGDEVMLVGMNDVGDWYEIVLDEGTAWIWGELVDADDTSSLPVTYGEDIESNYAPMQAFYFQSGIGDLQCNEAPNALIIQNPSGDAVQLQVNDLNVTIGSTLVITMDAVDNQQVIVLSLVEGYAEVESDTIVATLDDAGETVAITVNNDGRVDGNSQKVDFESDSFGNIIQNACENASQTGILEGIALQNCGVSVVATDSNVTDEQATTTTNTLAGVSDSDACVVASESTVNFRGGPGTNYNTVGQLTVKMLATVTGKADGTDGYLWWQTEGEKWVRSDLVSTGGACDSVATVEAPEPPVVETTTTATNAAGGTWYLGGVCSTTINVPAGMNYVGLTSAGMAPHQDVNEYVNLLTWDVRMNGVPLTPIGENYIQGNGVFRQFYIGPLEPGTYHLTSVVYFPDYSVSEWCTHIIGG